MLRTIAANFTLGTIAKLCPTWYKNRAEIRFWRGRYRVEGGNLQHTHYEYFYTEFFGLSADDYRGKAVLDIGCGPRGSLEWAEMAAERVGIDPLVPQYRKLGIDRHRMRYVHAGAEHIPFPDGHFDIVASFNNLDHVDDVAAAIREIKRVTKPSGLMLLITEVEHAATAAEPHTLPGDIARQFAPEFAVLSEEIFGLLNHDVYKSVRDRVPRKPGEAGLVCAKLKRRPI